MVSLRACFMTRSAPDSRLSSVTVKVAALVDVNLVDFLVKFVVFTLIMLALVYKCMYVPSDALSFVRVGRCQAALERRRAQAPPVTVSRSSRCKSKSCSAASRSAMISSVVKRGFCEGLSVLTDELSTDSAENARAFGCEICFCDLLSTNVMFSLFSPRVRRLRHLECCISVFIVSVG